MNSSTTITQTMREHAAQMYEADLLRMGAPAVQAHMMKSEIVSGRNDDAVRAAMKHMAGRQAAPATQQQSFFEQSFQSFSSSGQSMPQMPPAPPRTSQMPSRAPAEQRMQMGGPPEQHFSQPGFQGSGVPDGLAFKRPSPERMMQLQQESRRIEMEQGYSRPPKPPAYRNDYSQSHGLPAGPAGSMAQTTTTTTTTTSWEETFEEVDMGMTAQPVDQWGRPVGPPMPISPAQAQQYQQAGRVHPMSPVQPEDAMAALQGGMQSHTLNPGVAITKEKSGKAKKEKSGKSKSVAPASMPQDMPPVHSQTMPAPGLQQGVPSFAAQPAGIPHPQASPDAVGPQQAMQMRSNAIPPWNRPGPEPAPTPAAAAKRSSDKEKKKKKSSWF